MSNRKQIKHKQTENEFPKIKGRKHRIRETWKNNKHIEIMRKL